MKPSCVLLICLAALSDVALGGNFELREAEQVTDLLEGGARSLLSESDHKYQKADRIKLYGEYRHCCVSCFLHHELSKVRVEI